MRMSPKQIYKKTYFVKQNTMRLPNHISSNITISSLYETTVPLNNMSNFERLNKRLNKLLVKFLLDKINSCVIYK